MEAAGQRIARWTLVAGLAAGAVLHARADAITDWNLKTNQMIADAKLGTPPAVRALALVQTAAHEAVKDLGAEASAEAAIAAAHRATLAKAVPAQHAAVEAAYAAALVPIAEGPAKAAGILAGELAAARVMASRVDDSAPAESYRPHTTAGTYVPTTAVGATTWGARRPWLMADPAQFRPAPPPSLSSADWARDYNEVWMMGGKASTARTAEQTEIARFWEYSLPSIYHGVVHSVAAMPGRDVKRNARLFAAVAQAMDDALIAVFEAKYHYNFWRPATAIRNGDIDGHYGTRRDVAWASFSPAPLHPEYPSGHSILAGAVAGVLQAEVGQASGLVLRTVSPSANGAERQWTSLDAFTREVQDARIYEGIHFRAATHVGVDMGRKIAALAAAKHLR